MDRDELWAYRKKTGHELELVRILRRGTARPNWALVAFEAPESEGLQEWVPVGRLKVPWNDRERFVARENRWAAVAEASANVTEAQGWASGTVFDVVDSEQYIAYAVQGRPGVSVVSRPGEFAQKYGLEFSSLTAEPTAFEEDGSVVIPWAGTELLARTLASREPRKVLEAVQEAEGKAAAQRAVDVQRFRTTWNTSPYPNDQSMIWARTEQESRGIVRQWCGQPAADQWQELHTLRQEVVRLGSIVTKAASVLEAKGHKRDATAIRKLHGLP